MVYIFLVSWILFLYINLRFFGATSKDRKFFKSLKALIIIPLALLSYLLHPWLIKILPDRTWFALIMMTAVFLFSFGNFWILRRLRLQKDGTT